MPSIHLVTATLPSGDYCLGDALGVERKTSADLARSIIDGRLFRQVGSLRQTYRRPLLVVEGLCEGAAVVGVSWPALRGALVSVSVCFGVPVLRSTDASDSAALKWRGSAKDWHVRSVKRSEEKGRRKPIRSPSHPVTLTDS
jgi:ERCC4-type nuclease